MNGLALDVRLAIRALLGSRYVAVPAILTLALAIGANAGVFAIVNSLLLRPLPVADPDRLVSVTSDFAISHGFTAGAGWNTVMWEGLRAASAPFDGVLAWAPQRFTLGTGGDAERVDGFYGSGEFFATLGVRPRLGRLFSQDDDRAGDAVAVISHRLWVRRFGGAATAIGAPLIVDGVRTIVIGVAPEAFHGLEIGKPFDVALPIGADPAIRGSASLFSARYFGLLVMLRLKPGQTIASATSALRGLQAAIVPGNAPAFVKEPFVLVAADGTASGPASPLRVYRQPILIMLGGVALVLVIACVNIANLLVARGIARQRELGVRLALGASRWRLVRPLLIESLLIAVAGGGIGLLLATWIARALTAISPAVLDLPLDWRVVGFTAAVTVIAALGFGLAPAQRAAARAAALRRTAGGRSAPRERLSTGLVVLQIALALVVAIPAGLFVRTFVRLATRPLGFDAARVLVVNAGTTRVTGDPASRHLLYQALADAARAEPGVTAAAVSLWTPLSGAGGTVGVAAPAARDTREGVNVLANFVGPGWFAVYGTPIVAGRDFSASDAPASQKVVIVNEAFVRRFFADGQPIVGRLHDGNLVVGVAKDAVYRTARPIPGVTSVALREPVAPTIYAPLAQLTRWDRPSVTAVRISVRAAGSPRALVRAVGAALVRVEPNLLLEFRPLSDDVSASLVQERMSASASSFFGVFSLLLAALGIYGVTAYTVSRRTPEIGVRMALGATPARIRRLFLARALSAIGPGLLLGLAGAALASRSLTSLLFGVTALDPVILLSVSLLVVGITVAAALIPARRASQVDPWLSLRAE